MIHLELFHNYTAVPLYRWGDFVGISSTFLSPWLGFSKISISGSATMYTHGVLVQKITKINSFLFRASKTTRMMILTSRKQTILKKAVPRIEPTISPCLLLWILKMITKHNIIIVFCCCHACHIYTHMYTAVHTYMPMHSDHVITQC